MQIKKSKNNTIILKQLQILSEPLRIRILHVLEKGEFSVGELTIILQSPQSTISRHLKILQDWLHKRSVGASSWFRFKPSVLSPTNHQLWELLQQETCHLVTEDIDRMKSVLTLHRTDSQSFFNKIGEKWRHLKKDLFGDQFLLPTLLQLLPKNLVIADLGCGTGESLLSLAPLIKKVIGVDQSPEMLTICKKRTTHLDNVELRQGSIELLPIKNDEVDAIFCMLVLHHIKDTKLAFQEIHRTLKPNGRVIILDMITHTRQEFLRTMGHQHLGFAKETIYQLAKQQHLNVESWYILDKQEGTMGPQLFLTTLQK